MGEAFIVRRGGSAPIPSLFGDGRDGDLYIAAGQTVVLPVAVPHQSVVEKQYKSITIEAGGVLRCSAPNAGLVLRCKGNCTIHGTIDQSLMAPKTNANNTYAYPSELVCGAGGGGAKGMPQRPYGGGYGAGGAGGGSEYNGSSTGYGGEGGSAAEITIDIANIFVGAGRNFQGSGQAGQYGGGGAGGHTGSGGSGGEGGSGGGGSGGNGYSGNNGSGGGGGAGNYGGGIMLLYAQGTTQIAGNLLCTGGNGGNGGTGSGSNGQSGCGGGGGAFYCVYNTNLINSGNINVNGGTGSQAGGIGTITIKKYVKGMTA